jgi:hypothetical protein
MPIQVCRWERFARGALAIVFAVVFATCGDDDDTAGSFNLSFVWDETATPELDKQKLYAFARLQEWPGGDAAKASTLAEAGPVEIVKGATAALDFGGLTYGDNRVVSVDIRDAQARSARVVYFGVSELFSIVAGQVTEVPVRLNLRAAPGTDSSGATATDAVRLVGADGPLRVFPDAAGKDQTYTNAGEVQVELRYRSDEVATVTVANDASFSKNLRNWDVADLKPVESGDPALLAARLPEPWDLNAEVGAGEGLRQVFVRYTNAFGVASPTLSASVLFDPTPPTLTPSTDLAAHPANSTVRVTVLASEVLAETPVVTLTGPDGASLGPALVRAGLLSYVAEIPAADLPADGDWQVNVTGIDNAGNDGANTAAANFAVDRIAPDAPLSVSLGGTVFVAAVNTHFAKVGSTVTVALSVGEGQDFLAAESELTLGGIPLALDDTAEAPIWSRTLTGTEGEGTKRIGGVLRDAAGNFTAFDLPAVDAGGTAQGVTFDFTAPALLNPVVSPADANASANIAVSFGFTEPVASLSYDWAGLDAVRAFTADGANTAQTYLFTRPVDAGDSDGAYTLKVSNVTDYAGNALASATLGTVNITTTKPLVTGLALSHPRRSRVAALGSDGVPFNELTLRFNVAKDVGTTVPGLAVTLDGRPISTCSSKPASAAGFDYACVVTIGAADSEGLKNITVQTLDGAGNSDLASASVTFDFTAPVLVASRPNLTGAVYRGGDSVVYTVGFSEPLGDVPEVVIERAGANVTDFFGSPLPSGGNTGFVYTSKAVQPADDGSYSLAFRGTDDVGNRMDPAAPGTGFRVDAIKPVITKVSLATDNAAGVPDALKRGESVIAKFTVGETLTTAPSVTIDGEPLTRVGASTDPYEYRYATGANDTDGFRNVAVNVTDDAGNGASLNLGGVTFDFSPPALVSPSVAPPAANSASILTLSFGFTEPVSAPAPPAFASMDFAGLEGFAGGTDDGQNFVFTRPVQDTDDNGTYTFRVTPTDRVGNTASSALVIGQTTIDRTAPEIAELTAAPSPRSRVTGFSAFSIAFIVDEDVGTVAPGLTVAVGARPVTGCVRTPVAGKFSYVCAYTAGASDTEGVANVVVQATDAAGNSDVDSTTITFDFTPPVLSLGRPNLTSATYRAADRVVYTAEFSEPLATAPVLAVTRAGAPVTTLFTTAPVVSASRTSFVYTSRVLTTGDDGQYTLTFRGTDDAGNTQPTAQPGDTFTVDTIAPAVTPLNLTRTVVSRIEPFNLVSFRFDTSEALVLPSTALTATVGGKAANCFSEGTVGSLRRYRCEYTVTASDTVEGPRTVLVRVSDVAGNDNSVSDTVTFDFTAPDCGTLQFNADAPYRAGRVAEGALACSEPLGAKPEFSPYFNIGATYDDLLRLPAGDAAVIASTVLNGASTSVTLTTRALDALDEGYWSFDTSVVDAVGNAGPLLRFVGGFAVDTTAPTVELANLDGLYVVRPPASVKLATSRPMARLGDRVLLRLAGTGGAAILTASLGGVAMETDGAVTAFKYDVGDPDRLAGREGEQAVVVTATDDAGNAATATLGTVALDFTPPRIASSQVTPAMAGSNSTIRVEANLDEPAFNTRFDAMGLVAPQFGNDPSIWPASPTCANPADPQCSLFVPIEYENGRQRYVLSRPVRSTDENRAYTLRLYAEDEIGNAVSTDLENPLGWLELGTTTIDTVPIAVTQVAVETVTGPVAYLNRIADAEHPDEAPVPFFFVTFRVNKPVLPASLDVRVQGLAPITPNPVSGGDACEITTATNGGGFTGRCYYLRGDSAFTEGLANVVVQATDAAGNTGIGSTSVTFDFTPPRLTIGQPTQATYKSGARVTYIAEFSEPLRTTSRSVDGTPLRAYGLRDGIPVANFFAPPQVGGGGTTFTFTATAIVQAPDEGSYAVRFGAAPPAVVTDLAGNLLATDFSAAQGFAVDATPPNFSAGVPALETNNPFSPAYARAGDTVTARFATDAEPATLVATLGTAPMDLEMDGPSYAATFVVTGTEPQGLKPVSVSGSDAAGNAGSSLIGDGVTFDFDAPSVLAGTEGIQLTAPSSSPVSQVSAITVGTKIRASFAASEALYADPVVKTTTPAEYVFTLLSKSGAFYVYELEFADAAAAQGAYTVVADMIDQAGNPGRSTLSLPVPGFVVDTQAPSAPRTDIADAVTYKRTPWGSDATGGAARMTLRGGPGAVEGEGSIIVYSAATKPRSELGRAPTLADGSFAEFDLIASDRSSTFVAYTDKAGNESLAAQVRDTEWVATLGGIRNPHEYYRDPDLMGESVTDQRRLDTSQATRFALSRQDSTTSIATGNGSWEEFSPPASRPSSRFATALAYDRARRKVVMFGGLQDDLTDRREVGDTWELGTNGWVRIPTTVAPSPRQGHAMAYDSVRGKVLLFGGTVGTAETCSPRANTTMCADLWEWDGSTWAQINQGDVYPSGRREHAMAFDTHRGELLLFGGSRSDILSDFWKWDGAHWKNIPVVADDFFGLTGHIMAYDETRQRVVMLGGRNVFGEQGPSLVWEWDGTRWERIFPVQPDGFNSAAALEGAATYDRNIKKVVLVGAPFNQAWAYDGVKWTFYSAPPGDDGQGTFLESTPGVNFSMIYSDVLGGAVICGGSDQAASLDRTLLLKEGSWSVVQAGRYTAWPDALANAGMAFNERLRRLVLIGGTRDDGVSSETWWRVGLNSWLGGSQNSIGKREQFGIVYDPQRQGVVATHGSDGGRSYDNTWLLSGLSEWNNISSSGDRPASRWGAPIIYHRSEDSIILVGGAGDGRYFGDTWRRRDAKWERVISNSFPPRAAHALVYDSINHTTVMFGGDAGNGVVYYADTWELVGDEWTLKPTTVAPSARSGHMMVFDPKRERTILFGGADRSRSCSTFGERQCSDTWEWSGEFWSRVDSEISPPARAFGSATYDAEHARFVMYGGNDVTTRRNDLWEFDAGADSVSGNRVAMSLINAVEDFESSISLSVSTRWVAGGVGYPEGVTTNGAELLVWDEGQWKSIATNSASPDAPTEMTWTTVDPLQLNRIFFGDDKTLNFAVRPTAPNGTGKPGDPDNAYGKIATDYVEVTVKYRLPAETASP